MQLVSVIVEVPKQMRQRRSLRSTEIGEKVFQDYGIQDRQAQQQMAEEPVENPIITVVQAVVTERLEIMDHRAQ